MTDDIELGTQAFGGEWTAKKLDAVERYLAAFTTALANKPYELLYVDLFAGTGFSESRDEMYQLTGSAARALSVRDRPFDRFDFVEKDPDKCKSLENLKDQYGNRNIVIHPRDANEVLPELEIDPKNCRGVVFLDPYAADVEYRTIERIAGLCCLDTWLLFPTHAVSRMLSLDRRRAVDEKLTKVFGNDDWKGVYDQIQSTFGSDAKISRRSGTGDFVNLYKKRLRETFGARLLDKSLTLKNSRKSPLFELIFCTGNPRGIDVSHRIAKYIVEYETNRGSHVTRRPETQKTLEGYDG